MSAPLILALPSKGRPKEQTDAWLSKAGLTVKAAGGQRGYNALIEGVDGLDVRLLSAGNIAAALDAGEAHMGVTGEDLLRERGDAAFARVALVHALGFGHADVVVAAPAAWIDVSTMDDIDDVAHAYLARTGGRMRVATKYLNLTRSFFAAKGVGDYRIVASDGATEGAPAQSLAELIVDITTTGATLKANGLKILDDGVILQSQFNLAISKSTPWTTAQRRTAMLILDRLGVAPSALESL